MSGGLWQEATHTVLRDWGFEIQLERGMQTGGQDGEFGLWKLIGERHAGRHAR